MGRQADPVVERISSYLDEMVALRHDLHQNPELGYNEHRTSALVAGRLRDWGYQVTEGIGKTGVVGALQNGNGPKRLGIRADMDALPIVEATGLPYASTIPGKMHACGHDHSSTLVCRTPWAEEPGGYSPWGPKELGVTERLTFHPSPYRHSSSIQT